MQSQESGGTERGEGRSGEGVGRRQVLQKLHGTPSLSSSILPVPLAYPHHQQSSRSQSSQGRTSEVSHTLALELAPTHNGQLCLGYSSNRLTLRWAGTFTNTVFRQCSEKITNLACITRTLGKEDRSAPTNRPLIQPEIRGSRPVSDSQNPTLQGPSAQVSPFPSYGNHKCH